MLCICKVQILVCISLQEHSYAYLFTYSLWLLLCSMARCDRGLKSLKVFNWPFVEKVC